ncbi:hypothetical protein C7445_10858 [Alicyclobacillus sacchari]|uniref:Glycosyl transferase family 2 n=1 Tax=Alicyclobacillus sacchari TaxID=392010 RepID=A0A4R8LM53_9BACL|nr:hypothetical protein [Alicyclobacillus sacchari]TDY45246.1 hypothetical protein C7445_10858 [Alicyclobacillus sacchari]GMA56859.1 hypothetical protein GCM10025858_13620 [Alicyclobacillus sacchari]
MWPKLVLLVAALIYVALAVAGSGLAGLARRNPGDTQASLYVLLADNAEQHMEAVLRRLQRIARRRVQPLSVVVIDVASTDQTAAIAHRFSDPALAIAYVYTTNWDHARAEAGRIAAQAPANCDVRTLELRSGRSSFRQVM